MGSLGTAISKTQLDLAGRWLGGNTIDATPTSQASKCTVVDTDRRERERERDREREYIKRYREIEIRKARGRESKRR